MALKRYITNEKSLTKIDQWEIFHKGVQEYLDMGHAEPVLATCLIPLVRESLYLPMHRVVKESSSTTKLHVVFDGSTRSSTGVSLNDTLLPGPSLYPLLSTILNHFRMNPVAMVGGVSKMFREVGLVEEDRDLHRFLHKNIAGKIVDLRMSRVTLGITSSPFLAMQVLHQLADEYASLHPAAAKEIKQSFYLMMCLLEYRLWNMLHSSEKSSTPCSTRLRKWRASHPEVLDSILIDLQESSILSIATSPNCYAKTLGLHWNTDQDSFYISIPDISSI